MKDFVFLNLFSDFFPNLFDIYADNLQVLIYHISNLNHEGRKEILKRTIELNQIKKYTKKDNK